MIFLKNQSQLYHVTFLLTICQWLPIVLGIWPCLTLQLHVPSLTFSFSGLLPTPQTALWPQDLFTYVFLSLGSSFNWLLHHRFGYFALLGSVYKCHFFHLPANHNSLCSPHFHSTFLYLLAPCADCLHNIYLTTDLSLCCLLTRP